MMLEDMYLLWSYSHSHHNFASSASTLTQTEAQLALFDICAPTHLAATATAMENYNSTPVNASKTKNYFRIP